MDTPNPVNPAAVPVAEAKPRTFKQFLETAAPDTREIVSERVGDLVRGHGGAVFRRVSRPRLRMYCSHCDGLQNFDETGEFASSISRNAQFVHITLRYLCKNCDQSQKTYYLAFWGDDKS